MASKPRRRTSAGNTFTKEEINGIVQLLDILHRGSDPGVVLRQAAVVSLYSKFRRMKLRLENQRHPQAARGKHE